MEVLDKIKSFFSSKLGKIVIVLLVVAILVFFVAIPQYEKFIYKGMTRKQLAQKLASMRSSQHIAWVKGNDANYLKATTEEIKLGILQWYAENVNWSEQTTEDWIKQSLTDLGIDFIKYPQVLSIKSEMIPYINIVSA